MLCPFARMMSRSSLSVAHISETVTWIFRWSSTSTRGKLMVCSTKTIAISLWKSVHTYYYLLHTELLFICVAELL